MATEEHRKLAEQIENAINGKDVDAFRMLHLENVTAWNPTSSGPTTGIEAHLEEMQGLWNAFPDLTVEMTRVFGEGEWVCTEYTIQGTHKGPMKGPAGEEIPPTGKALRLEALGIIRIENGKIAEEKDFFDTGSMAAQLGLTP